MNFSSKGRRRTGVGRHVLPVVASLCVLAAASKEVRTDTLPRSLLVDSRERMALRRAFSGARRLLEKPACQKLFSDFTDPSGRPLQARLDELGLTGTDYLGTILFVDGHRLKSCGDGRALAVTEPASRVVHICGSRFALATDRTPEHAEATIVHEALHTLGLGENPPASHEITSRVLMRCRP